jgi:type IV pilus assembly protein PilW
MLRAGPKAASRRRQAGLSLIELMISITIGLIILTAMALVFVNASSTRTELERVSRQIENGRYAIELLSSDLRMAGFYGELDVGTIAGTALPANPCSLTPADWNAAIPVHVQGYDNAGFASANCALSNQRPNTDVVIVRRARACIAGTTGCDTVVAGQPYLQVSLCPTDPGTDRHALGPEGSTTFSYRKKDCAATADKRLYYVHIYYVSNDNGEGQAIPTLKRLELSYSGGLTWTDMPLVEGIEEFNVEYGIDQDGDGAPDAYTADPSDFPVGACAGNCPLNNWMNAVTTRIFLLARNLEMSQDYTDSKTYSLGNDKNGTEVTVTPGGKYRRHVYSSLVRIANVSNRRDAP